MMNLLRRFEENSLDEPFAEEEAEADEEDLQRRLAGMDLDTISHDQLWSILTPSERDRFVKTMQDPSSELAQQLLASQELAEEAIEPCPGFPLAYNLVAIFIAYAYTTRTFSVSPLSSPSPSSPDALEARNSFGRLVPFLTDKKASTRFESLGSVVTDVWSRFEPGTMTPVLFSLLLHDTAMLLRPQPVTVIASLDDHDSTAASEGESTMAAPPALYALSDLHALFLQNRDQNHIAAKVMFYAAQVQLAPSALLATLVREVEIKAGEVEREGLMGAGIREKDVDRPQQLGSRSGDQNRPAFRQPASSERLQIQRALSVPSLQPVRATDKGIGPPKKMKGNREACTPPSPVKRGDFFAAMTPSMTSAYSNVSTPPVELKSSFMVDAVPASVRLKISWRKRVDVEQKASRRASGYQVISWPTTKGRRSEIERKHSDLYKYGNDGRTWDLACCRWEDIANTILEKPFLNPA
ncbi:hypothetical protein EW146_g8212 [Bondarzewia mesenterica]|uniref:Uncharacterized protein n=1 Tax=Bondarzewia mesenterica TaxID=1095465 RepID=A0A4S4LG90_9AGAM|nr:hypothetical protein EW146_g8212 [Bondarzewia mesenterica]